MNDETSAASQADVIDYQDLAEAQHRQYNSLIAETARMVRGGLFTLEEIRPTAVVPDNAKPSEEFADRFSDDVEDELESLTPAHAERKQQRRQQQTTTNAQGIDWPELWLNAISDATKPLSWTQAALAVDVSEQTPITSEGAKSLLQDAVDAGQLKEFPRKQRLKPVSGGER